MPFAFALLSLPGIGVAFIVFALKERGLPWLIFLPLMIVGGAWLFTLFFVWAAFCAGITTFTVSNPSVTHNWVYYITAFFLFESPIGYMASKEEELSERQASVQVPITVWWLIATVMFVVLCIWPGLASPAQPVLKWIPGYKVVGAALEDQRDEGQNDTAISAKSRRILAERFLLDQMSQLLAEGPTRSQANERLLRLGLQFWKTKEQPPDGELRPFTDVYWATEPVLAVQAHYLGESRALIVLLLVLHPSADTDVRRLMESPLHASTAPGPVGEVGRVYFLGDYRMATHRIVRVVLREDTFQGRKAYSIVYAISEG